MDEHKNVVSDVLGVKPVAEAALVVAKAAADGAAAFLSKLCLPATEELGLLLRDQVASWRTARAVAMAQKAEAKMRAVQVDLDEVKVHPRLGIAIVDQSSWTDDDLLQDMWAGLLVSAATPDGRDESNLMFTDLLGRLTAAQARLLEFMCEQAEKGRTKLGLILAITSLTIPLEGAKKISQLADIQQLDRELDYLRTLGLIGGGLSTNETEDAAEPPPPAIVAPTTLALHMYARCRGARDPLAFYGLVDAAPVRIVSMGLGESLVIRPTPKQ
jgi:hypothetical protein